MEILIGIGTFVAFVLLMYCIFAFVWMGSMDKTAPRISFIAFKKFYLISPSNWRLYFDNSVEYYGNHGWMDIEFKHYIDVVRYSFFKRKVERDGEYLEKIQNETRFITSVQNDIDSYRRENLAELGRIINDAQSNAENLLQKAEVNSGGDDY